MLDKTILKLEEVMRGEYVLAAKDHGGTFSSPHEGYAVIIEELEEACEAIQAVEDFVHGNLWIKIRNDAPAAEDELKKARRLAILAAGECVQVAAMIEKYKYSQEVRK